MRIWKKNLVSFPRPSRFFGNDGPNFLKWRILGHRPAYFPPWNRTVYRTPSAKDMANLRGPWILKLGKGLIWTCFSPWINFQIRQLILGWAFWKFLKCVSKNFSGPFRSFFLNFSQIFRKIELFKNVKLV